MHSRATSLIWHKHNTLIWQDTSQVKNLNILWVHTKSWLLLDLNLSLIEVGKYCLLESCSKILENVADLWRLEEICDTYQKLFKTIQVNLYEFL